MNQQHALRRLQVLKRIILQPRSNNYVQNNLRHFSDSTKVTIGEISKEIKVPKVLPYVPHLYSKEEKQVYRLLYLDLRARAEPVRWCLNLYGIEYTEEIIQLKDWSKKKTELEWGKAPVLFVNEKQLHQTVVICKYLADSHGLTPLDSWEEAKLLEVAESINDVATIIGDVLVGRMMRQEEKSKMAFDKWRSRAYEVAEIINKNITEEGWIRSKKMSYVDVIVAAFMDYSEEYFEEILENFPKLLKMVNNVRKIPSIQSYLKNRPPLSLFESVEGLKTK